MNLPERRLSDVARARRRAELMEAVAAERGRRPWVAPLAAAAVVAVVGGAAYGVTALRDSAESDSLPVGGSGSASVEPTTAQETTAPTTPTDATAEACESRQPQNPRQMMRQQMRDYREQQDDVQVFRDVLARHLDPSGQHLDVQATNVQSSGSGCGLSALGTKVGWSTPGQEGLGMVRVEVASGAEPTQVHMSHGGWRPLRTDVPGVGSAEQVEYDGGFAVEVVRDDGLTVAIDANVLFGNNSLDPVGALPFGIADLVEVAVDPGLRLP